MTISAVVCTCNGELYLGAQLRSIIDQRRPPDEIIVSDDGSTDATVTVANEVLRATTIPARVISGGPRLGTVGNFERALRAASADVIAFADQDDVWAPDKLERAETALCDSGADAVFSDADLINEAGKPMGRRLWDTVGFDTRQRRRFQEDPLGILFRSYPVCGAAMLVRSSLLPLALPFSRHALHDEWLALLAAITGTIDPIPIPLIQYRVHSGNQVGVAERNPLNRLRRRRATGTRGSELALYRDLVARLEEHAMHTLDESVRSRLAAKIAHLEHRASLPNAVGTRIAACSRELVAGRYGRYSRGFGSFFFDAVFKPTRERQAEHEDR